MLLAASTPNNRVESRRARKHFRYVFARPSLRLAVARSAVVGTFNLSCLARQPSRLKNDVGNIPHATRFREIFRQRHSIVPPMPQMVNHGLQPDRVHTPQY